GEVRLYRIEIGIAGDYRHPCYWRGPQLGFQPLRPARSQVQRFEVTIESDEVRQVVVEISRADSYAVVPERLFNSHVPAEAVCRSEVKIIAEDFILAAGWAETGGDTCMQNCFRFVDGTVAGKPVGPNITELI